MQIGRQLNRNTPKLADKDKYPEGLRELVAFTLNSDPVTRPAMADILSHPYIAESEENYPTSSLGELVRIYYQWSQRGGQRISLFHPGGAAAAEMPDAESDVDDDWNFSTTDDFQKRFSVIDLDQLAASLAEFEQEIKESAKQSQQEPADEPSDPELSEEDKANFDERVRRGAVAMEGLFNEEVPGYKYETKNDFVPIEPKPPVSDLPLRTDTDRSSVTSTFIDIDIGSFDSSHYAAAAATATQPFQLADADTIRANRSSGRNRSFNEGRSRSSSSGLSGSFDGQDTFQPRSGPRPPTMDWKFPTFMAAPSEEAESISDTVPETVPEVDSGTEAEFESEAESTSVQDTTASSFDPSAKRATMEWTFPVMSSSADFVAPMDSFSEEDEDGPPSRKDTLKPSDQRSSMSLGEPGPGDISRPSTSASAQSSMSTSSDTDYDPFRFDRPSTPPDGASIHQQNFIENDYPEILNSVGYNTYKRSSVLEGPGPDEEEDTTPVWQNTIQSTGPTPYTNAFPTAPTSIPHKETGMGHHRPFPSATIIADGPGPDEPLHTAKYNPSTAAQGLEQAQAQTQAQPIKFPNLIPPRLEVLMEGAGEGAVSAELDRLLGDFLDALSATGDALSQTKGTGMGLSMASANRRGDDLNLEKTE